MSRRMLVNISSGIVLGILTIPLTVYLSGPNLFLAGVLLGWMARQILPDRDEPGSESGPRDSSQLGRPKRRGLVYEIRMSLAVQLISWTLDVFPNDAPETGEYAALMVAFLKGYVERERSVDA